MLRAVENLLVKSLGLRANDSLAFIHDSVYRPLREPVHKVAAEFGISAVSLETPYDGICPLNADVTDILLGKVHQVILFGLVHNIWHTPERKKAKYDLKKRLSSLVCAPDDLGSGASLADIELLGRVSRAIAPLFNRGAQFTARTPAGTDFSAIIETPFCEDGQYNLPGTGGDFPAGEVGFGPRLGSVNGTIVYDLKVQHIGVLRSPLILGVREDKIVEVSGESRYDFLRICKERGEILNYISEVSVGINPAGILTPAAQFIPEEKNYGTMHCGHGGNSSYGNRVGPHIDGVMNKPTVEIDGVLLMQDGRLAPIYTDKGSQF